MMAGKETDQPLRRPTSGSLFRNVPEHAGLIENVGHYQTSRLKFWSDRSLDAIPPGQVLPVECMQQEGKRAELHGRSLPGPLERFV